MNIEQALQKIREIGIVPVVRASSFEEARQAVDAICSGGISVVEITMTVPNAVAVIREVVRKYGDSVLTGAGTVLSFEQAAQCLDAGAEFLVSPGLSVPVLHAAQARGKLAIPGALTPTEVIAASVQGARVIKIFPCESVGGTKYIKALKGPFPRMEFIPTGGVNLLNAAEYIAAGAFALGVGSDLVNAAALRDGKTQDIIDTAKKLVEIVGQARAKSASH
ncbi:MAG TPA: bifunctional 4-hydroxy-2-oxoglutarate aldolase/2-dehydro-3-deoxy-phosphogluconate aldolase [Candidatus Dormibacteraeota bacterium]|nr:bifunctional 4-hydroxy-2-oxoglutarate aldolase/2-dehydro-3-deoxy-phosphogluconate aldolase [Candidatus Dormibacteraeota bacterium]